MKKEDMSPAAKKLIEICGLEGSVAGALKTNPELVTGLDEYVEWVGDQQRMIEEKQETPSASHSLKNVANSLSSPAKIKKVKN